MYICDDTAERLIRIAFAYGRSFRYVFIANYFILRIPRMNKINIKLYKLMVNYARNKKQINYTHFCLASENNFGSSVAK